ncbi:MAG: formyltransferase family protein, partial [Patescibacteria group bacterium]
IENDVPCDTSLNIDCDLALVADFGQIIPEEIFNKPKLGTFNIHFSKLPDLRGPSPVQSTLLRGDTTAWITIFKLDEKMDTGPILDQRSFPIFPDDTAQTLYIRFFKEAAKYITALDFSKKLLPQSGTPTFCKMLKREDGFIKYEDLENPENYNKFRAYFPWPGIWTIKNDKRMKILKCHLENQRMVLDQIQFEGKKSQGC